LWLWTLAVFKISKKKVKKKKLEKYFPGMYGHKRILYTTPARVLNVFLASP